MKSILIAPRKYVQGRGVIKEIGGYLRLLGKKPLVLWTPASRASWASGSWRACARRA